MPFDAVGRDIESNANPSLSGTGTEHAIYSNSTSARRLGGKQGISGWGGARNRADRTNDALSLKQASGIIAAAQFAATAGLALNRHVTIHLERAGIPDNRAATAIGAFLRLVRDHFRKRGQRTAWAWVRENGDGKGTHVHILLHVPAGARWSYQRLRRWLERVTGQPYLADVIQTTRIGGTARAYANAPAVYQVNLAKVVGYAIKGASPDAARILGLEKLEAGGRIIGKRAGWSQNIGAAAR